MFTIVKPELKEGSLMVWHIPQMPMKAFKVYVDTIEEGQQVMDLLATYDDFEFRNRVKPDYSNISGLSRLEPFIDASESDLLEAEAEGHPDLEWIDIDCSDLAEEWETFQESRSGQ